MKRYCLVITTAMLLCIAYNHASAQDDNLSGAKVPSLYFETVSKKANTIGEKIEAKTEKALSHLLKQEEKLRRKLSRIDSLAANNIFTTAEQRYKNLEQKLSNPGKLSQYIPFLDTIKTSLKFLDKNKQLLSGTKDIKDKIDAAMDKVNGLENELHKAEQVKQFLQQEKQLLKEQLEKFGLTKQLKKLNKDVYYYSQQINEYKEIIKDPKKMERKAIDLISRTKLFQDFMKKNSLLASMFRMPADDSNDPAYIQSLAGLQTRAQVNQLIQNQIGGGPNAMQQIQNNVQQARDQLQQLRNKLNEYGMNSSDSDMPDFKPNNQKTKSFLKRIEIGTNFQSQRGNGLLPVTSDLSLSAGYKVSDNSIIGIGASYKMGWGKNIQHIKISHQGVGLRSFIDIKWKRLLWVTGGYEMNYLTAFSKMAQLKNYSAWQQSGMIGLSKKFSVNTKLFKNTKLQLLWDLLSYRQVPRTQPVIVRVGYTF